MPTVRTRFAPSPTGYMHIGGLRTALYAYLLAKQSNGQFILRIEDTDQERYVDGAVEVIYRTLKMAGLHYDEGPDIGGAFGPYVQSQRKALYLEQAQKLVELGGAYYCFCSQERLDKLRKEAEDRKEIFKYDGLCKKLTPDEIKKRIANGDPYIIRQNIPPSGQTGFKDEVYGEITVENSQLDENVLLKTDGLPTYNFANVVDDHLMGISHVIRGNEYLSQSPKYCLLYRSFGWEEPKYVHVSQIIRPDGKKLSKRSGDASFDDFYTKGFLTEAIVNYIALLGWNSKDDREIFSLAELTEAFSVAGLSKSPAIFDVEKLKWMNGEYIRKMTPEDFYQAALPWLQQAVKRSGVDLHKLAGLMQQRTVVLSDIPARIDFIDVLPEYAREMFINKKAKTDLVNSLEYLKTCQAELEKLEKFDHETIKQALYAVVETLGIKANTFLTPLRIALSGREVTPGGATELAEILGKEECLKRINIGIGKLTN
ncbi:MAG: glutamate--tRNA ligase [bacterium]|nr:glutamate--tRNA ligase [bacterium]